MSRAVSKNEIMETTDYDIFILVGGNRAVDKQHVARLKRKMIDNGNLTQSFPIVVNEKMEVIDGQHRLTALKELDWPVFYTVQKHLTLDTVRAINTASKNWSWKDYAESYASLGNEEYKRFLAMYHHFGYNYAILHYYAMGGHSGSKGTRTEDVGRSSRTSKFFKGDFKFPDQAKTFEQLKLLQEVEDVLMPDHTMNRELAYALHTAFTSEDYDHKRMLDKMESYGVTAIRRYRTRLDYLRALEDIYNWHVHEENRARLF